MKRKNLLLILLLFVSIFSISFVYASEYDAVSEFRNRLHGAIIVFLVVIIFCLILFYILLKPEPKVIKENMSNRYVELSGEVLKRLGINCDEFKTLIGQKFIDIHMALNDYDYDKLKINLTNDLYKAYCEQLSELKDKGYHNIMKDLEIIEVKIYNINNAYGNLFVDVYMNVKMFDYTIDKNINCLIKGNDTKKVNLEFEVTFVRRLKFKCPNCNELIYGNLDKCPKCKMLFANCNYVMSKKTCVNYMDENEKVDVG